MFPFKNLNPIKQRVTAFVKSKKGVTFLEYCALGALAVVIIIFGSKKIDEGTDKAIAAGQGVATQTQAVGTVANTGFSAIFEAAS